MTRNPRYQKVRGIILARKPLREADLLLTIYTRERGKIRVLARGVRKANAKLAGKLQQLYNTELYLAGSGIWPVVTSSTIIDKYSRIRNSLSVLSLAFYAAELVVKLTPDGEDNPRIYELFDRYLTELSRSHKKIKITDTEKTWPPILEKFRLDLLRIIGHGVTIRFCAHCGIKVTPGINVCFSCFAGGIVHTECNKYPDIRSLSSVTAGQLALLDQQALEDVSDLVVGEEGHRSLSDFVTFLLERDVQSEKFLEQVRE